MGKIKKILENELVGGTQTTDVYPVTSIKAVYDENNERLDHILSRRGVVNISTNYNADHIAEVLTLEQAINKVPMSDKVLGFTMTFLSSDGWETYQFTGDSITDWNNIDRWKFIITSSGLKQTTGQSITTLMSQKAVTDELNKINANMGIDKYPVFSNQTAYKAGDVINYMGELYQFMSDHAAGAWTGMDIKKYSLKDREDYLELNINSQNLYPKLRLNRGYYINIDNYKVSDRETSTNFAFKVNEGETIVYTGNYGGHCPAIIFYKGGEILSTITKKDLGADVTIEVIVPKGADSAVANSFNTDVSVVFKDGVLTSLEKKLEEIDAAIISTIALYGQPLQIVSGYVGTNGKLIASDKGAERTNKIIVSEIDAFIYSGSYGGSCAGIAYYTENNELISVESKENLGMVHDVEFAVPSNARYAIASSFRPSLKLYVKDSSYDRGIKADNEIRNKIITCSLSKKFKAYKADNVNIDAIDKAILFAAFVPNAGYENDNICINALSAYYSNTSETNTPARYDVWVYNVTKSKDVINWRNLYPETQARFQKIYLSSKSGQIYLIIDTEVLKNYNENGVYKAIIWGDRSLIINNFTLENNPFLSSAIWDENYKPIKPLNNFSIVWFGTSIPAGGYPIIVGKYLNCTVYNEAVGESLVRLGWGKNCIAKDDEIDKWGCSGTDTGSFNPVSNTITALAKSMSATKAEKQYLIDNLEHFESITNSTLNRKVQTDDVIMGYSYEEKLLKYIDSSRDDYTPVDLIVFDHGHNDLNPDGDPKWDTYQIDNRDKDNYWGAMNFLMDVIRKYNPHQMVCQISHYQGNVDYSANFYKAQQQFAEHWGIPFMELYKFTQMSTSEQVRTSGYWGYTDGIWHDTGFVFTDNGDGTYTTNQSCIIQYDFGISNGSYDRETQLFTSDVLKELPITTKARDIKDVDGIKTCLLKPREAFMKDRLHPHSDLSGNATNTLAKLISAWLNSVYKIGADTDKK